MGSKMRLFVGVLVSSLVAVGAVGCDKKGDGAAPAGSGGGGTTSSAKGTKACPDGAPFCVTLPAGWSLGTDKRSGAWGNSIDCKGPDANLQCTLYWVKPEEYDGRVAGDASFMKADPNAKTEKILGGKGEYHEWSASDPKEDRHFIVAYVKGDTNTWQCSGTQPKASTSKDLESICKSIAPK